MKKNIATYLDNVFAARNLPTIAWGPFLQYLVACVNADGGTFHELHGYFEMPPKITGRYWENVSIEEIRKYLGW